MLNNATLCHFANTPIFSNCEQVSGIKYTFCTLPSKILDGNGKLDCNMAKLSVGAWARIYGEGLINIDATRKRPNANSS